MVTDTNLPMPISVLMFLAGLGGTVVAVLAILFFIGLGKKRLAKAAGLAWTACAGVYVAALLACSAVSQEAMLPVGQEKHFCEIDCHIANSVAGARRSDPNHVVVTVRTRFDPATVGPRRGDAPLQPSAHQLRLMDAAGEHVGRELPAASAEERGAGTPLRPGESYVTRYEFATAAPLEGAKLFIGNAGVPEVVLIGNEASWGHRKTYFAL